MTRPVLCLLTAALAAEVVAGAGHTPLAASVVRWMTALAGLRD